MDAVHILAPIEFQSNPTIIRIKYNLLKINIFEKYKMLDVNKNYPFRLQCAPLFNLSPTEKHHNILVNNVNEVLAPSTNKLFKTSTRPKRGTAKLAIKWTNLMVKISCLLHFLHLKQCLILPRELFLRQSSRVVVSTMKMFFLVVV